MLHHHVSQVTIDPSLLIRRHRHVVEVDFGAIVLKPGDELHLEDLGRRWVVAFVHLEVLLMECLHIVHREHQIVSVRTLELVLAL